MNSSLIEIIGSAIAAARQVGLSFSEEEDAACAVLAALDTSLTPGTARVLVEQLHASGIALAEQGWTA
jgi:hypothetical protein